MTVGREPVVVIGIGNTLRRDDGVGPLLVDSLSTDKPGGCDLVALDGETIRVIEAWSDREIAVVVDAVCAGADPGTLHDLTIENLEDLATVGLLSPTSSHTAGLAEAVALGRSLDRLPTTLRVIGIEPADLSYGSGLSPCVASSMDMLARQVRGAVADRRPDSNSANISPKVPLS